MFFIRDKLLGFVVIVVVVVGTTDSYSQPYTCTCYAAGGLGDYNYIEYWYLRYNFPNFTIEWKVFKLFKFYLVGKFQAVKWIVTKV